MASKQEALIQQGLELLVSELTEAHRAIKTAKRTGFTGEGEPTYLLTASEAMIVRSNVYAAMMHLDTLKRNLNNLQGSLFS